MLRFWNIPKYPEVNFVWSSVSLSLFFLAFSNAYIYPNNNIVDLSVYIFQKNYNIIYLFIYFNVFVFIEWMIDWLIN